MKEQGLVKKKTYLSVSNFDEDEVVVLLMSCFLRSVALKLVVEAQGLKQ